MKEMYEALDYYIKVNNGEIPANPNAKGAPNAVSDVITASDSDHDNGFIDWGDFE